MTRRFIKPVPSLSGDDTKTVCGRGTPVHTACVPGSLIDHTSCWEENRKLKRELERARTELLMLRTRVMDAMEPDTDVDFDPSEWR